MSLSAVLSPVKANRARSLLRAFCERHHTIQACALVTSDGRLAASFLGPRIDPDRFGAMSAALLALGTQTAREAQRGDFVQLILQGKGGPVLITRSGECGILAVTATWDGPLGPLLLGSRAAARSLASLMDEVA